MISRAITATKNKTPLNNDRPHDVAGLVLEVNKLARCDDEPTSCIGSAKWLHLGEITIYEWTTLGPSALRV
jgi:hypothetical protein